MNSFPKSGTNLLRQILKGFAVITPFREYPGRIILTYESASGEKRSPADIKKDLSLFLPGDIGRGHLHAEPEIRELLSRENFINIFLYRDPRDVVVSHAFYVTRIADTHVHHDYYQNQLSDTSERIRTSITGLPGAGVEFPDIRKRYDPYLGWLEVPGVLPVKFEDLINRRKSSLQKMLDHICGKLDGKNISFQEQPERILESMEAAIDPRGSRTFRKGTTGDWKNHFSEEHKLLFKEITGDLLIRLGYEMDQDW